ncbi:ABC-type molybdate transport system permease subunit [Bradyrhizobium sp. F1.13.4]
MLDISPAEWTAILLSLRVAVIATLVANAVRHCAGVAARAA